MLNLKHSAKYASRTGTLASSTARAATSCEMTQQKNKKYIKSVLDLFSIPNFYIRKGPTARSPIREERRTANQLQKKCRKRGYSNIHDRFIRDTWFRKNHAGIKSYRRSDSRDGQTGERNTTPTLPQKKNSTYTVAIGGYVRILWVPTRCLQGIVLTSNKRCQPCIASRKQRMKLIIKNWWQSSSSSWWQWQDSWWHPSPETSPRRWT